MSQIEIVEVTNRKQRRAFCQVQLDIFRDCAYFVPPLLADEMEMLNPARNPAFDTADARSFLAYHDGKAVGRVMAIDSEAANRKFQTQDMRFGWFDCYDDYAVAEALLGQVEKWARERGCTTITGPHGFNFFDKEGMLVEGYDELPTFATSYNHPYYNDLVTRYGFEKKLDFIEFRTEIDPSDPFPERLARLCDKLAKRGGFRVVNFKSKRELLARTTAVFELLDEAYETLDDMVPLTQRQKEFYLNKFNGVIHKDLAKLVEHESGEVAGFMIGIPSLSRALQKTRGKLLPFGWWHLLKALRSGDTLDMCLAGVRNKYRGRGVDALLIQAMHESATKLGIKHAESNPELETNTRIQSEWKPFGARQHKRRRIYIKHL